MKFIIATLALLFSVNSMAVTVSTKDIGDDPNILFDFTVMGCGPGCATYGNLESQPGFPQAWDVQKIRFIFAQQGFDKVNDPNQSLQIEVPISMDSQVPTVPRLNIGNLAAGRWFFKAALIDWMGNMIYMTPDYATDIRRHSILIR
ncbi:MAG TPA: hypothetical protein VM432_01595 [Bdellovibrionales bacterium]|jgi:hypothetical protein|nr:hypothetical protein [Bdellovibrionales bacterium]